MYEVQDKGKMLTSLGQKAHIIYTLDKMISF